MLGASRANVDLLVFSVMVLALGLVNRHTVAALLALITGVLFKLFPILGVVVFLDKDRNAGLKYIAAAAGLSLLYFAITFSDMLSIFRITPRGLEEAYGAAVLPALLNRLATAPDLREHSVGYVRALRGAHNLLMQFPIAPYLLAAVIVLTCGVSGPAPQGSAGRSRRAQPAGFLDGGRSVRGHIPAGQQFRVSPDLPVAVHSATVRVGHWGINAARPRQSDWPWRLIFAALWAMILQQPVSGTVPLAANSAGLLDQIRELDPSGRDCVPVSVIAANLGGLRRARPRGCSG